jgi:nucleotide-binding universal stress UspA family protein
MGSAIRHILVPVDGSEGARHALQLAADMADRWGARLTLLEVIEEAGPLPSFDERPPEGETREHWLSEQRFEPIRRDLQQVQVPWERRVEQGIPPDVICRVAEEEHVDLIVMGHRGMSAVGRWLVGSVSDRVVHHAPCSVTVVR